MDAGLTRDSLLHNMDVLEIRPAVPSRHRPEPRPHGPRGRPDGPPRGRAGAGCPWCCTPTRSSGGKIVLPDGAEVLLPPPDRPASSRRAWSASRSRGLAPTSEVLGLVTGQVAVDHRLQTASPSLREIDRRAAAGPAIHDDQAVVMNVRNAGAWWWPLGAATPGIVNVLRHSMAVTGVGHVDAVLGGFHLTGRLFEPLIPPTVAALTEMAPRLVVPSHCTGWRATHAIARALPDAFVPNSVGTTFVIDAA